MQIQKDGFTLIELVVVIAIIALLLSILMPALNKVKDTAKSITCRAHIRQFAIANHTYAASNDDRLVSVFWVMNEEFWSYVGLDSGSFAQLKNAWYVTYSFSDMKISDLVCPSVNKKNIASNHCYPFTYAYNNGGQIWHNVDKVIRITKIKSPSERVSFIDSSDMACNGPGGGAFTNSTVGINYKLHWDVVGDWWGDGHGGVISYRHAEGANMAMVDGHVEYRKKEEVWLVNPNGFPNYGVMAKTWDLFDEQFPP